MNLYNDSELNWHLENGTGLKVAQRTNYPWDGQVPIKRNWSAGDVIRLHMEMPPQVIQASPRVIDDSGRVAVQRGPLVYCLEELDQPDGVSLVNVALDLANPSEESFQSQLQADLLGGVVVLRHVG